MFNFITILKLSFSLSLYAPITSTECHALFHLNSASPAARKTQQVSIAKKSYSKQDLNPQTTRKPAYKSTVLTAVPHLDCYK